MSFDAGKAPCPYSLPLFARVDSDQSHGSLPRHRRYRRHILGFRPSQRADRRNIDREDSLDADDPSRAILAGIEGLLADITGADDIGYFCHGTTVGTNALLEGKGVRTGLLVTEGFRGI
jgi:hypothetical protein